MRYRDALGLFECDLSLGWTLNLSTSTLLQIEFCWWRGEAHKLGVQLLPRLAPAEADDRQWFEALSRSIEPPSLRPQSFQRRQGRVIAIGRETTSGPNIEHKFVYVHGTMHDIALHQIEAAGQASSAPDREAVLDELLRGILGTLRLFAEHRPPRAPTYEELRALGARAFELADSIDPASAGVHAEAAGAARVLVDACTDVVLAHLCGGHPPPMEAACMLADGQLIRWQAERADATLLKDARTIVHRVRLAYAEALAHDAKSRANVDALAARIMQAEAELIAPQSISEIMAADAFGRGRTRARWCMQQAAAHTAAGRANIAEDCLYDAVSDMVQALAIPKHSVWVSDEHKAIFEAYAATPEQMARVVGLADRRAAIYELREALLQLLDLSFSGGDASREAEVATLLVDVADAALEIADVPVDFPGHMKVTTISPAQWMYCIEDRLRLARACAGLGDAPALERGRRVFEDAGRLLEDLERGRGGESVLARMPDDVIANLQACIADLRMQWGAAGELLERVQQHRGLEPEDLEKIGAADAPLPPAGSSPYELLWAAYQRGAHATIALNDGRVDAALHGIRQGLACALMVSPFNEQVRSLLLLAAHALPRRPPGSPDDDDRVRQTTAWLLTLEAAADALDAARWETRSEAGRVALGDSRLAQDVVEQLVELFAFRANMPEYAIAATDRFRARVLDQALQEHLRAAAVVPPPAAAPPDLMTMGDDDLTALLEAVTYVINQAHAVAEMRGLPPKLDPAAIAAIAQQRGAALLWIQPIGARIALLLMGPDGQARSVWSPLSLPRWRGAAEALLESPDRTELQRRLWEALFEPLQAHLADGSHVIVMPPADGALVPYGLLHDAGGRFAVDRFAISLAPSLATLRTLGARGLWVRPRPRRAFVLGDPAAGGDRVETLPAARAEARAVKKQLLRAGVPEPAISLRLGGAADLEAYRREAAYCDLVHLACHAEIVAAATGQTVSLRFAGSTHAALQAAEVPDVPLADALVVLSACSSGQGRTTADGVIGLGRAFLQAGARAVVMSLWPVRDEVAAMLFAHFYAALLHEPGTCDAAQALAEATRRTRGDLAQQLLSGEAGPLPPDAAYWAPFVIVGDAQAIRFEAESGV